jgi:hypothetical protein
MNIDNEKFIKAWQKKHTYESFFMISYEEIKKILCKTNLVDSNEDIVNIETIDDGFAITTRKLKHEKEYTNKITSIH